MAGGICKRTCLYKPANQKPISKERQSMYVNNIYCAECDTWWLRESITMGNRCPCCNGSLRRHARQNRRINWEASRRKLGKLA